MKFYQLNDNELVKELKTDLSSGLNDEQILSRKFECSNLCNSNIFSTPEINHDFSKSIVFAIISFVIYIISAIFSKRFSPIIDLLCLLIIVSLFFAFIYCVLKLINNKIRKLNNTFLRVNVIRNGIKITIPASELVYGDVIFLEKGDYIPCDARIISCEALLVDESLVNSQNTVKKDCGVILNDNVNSSELYNCVFCGSFVVNGSAKAVVTDVGERVYILKSHKHTLKKHKISSSLLDFFKFLFLVSLLVFTAIFFIVLILNAENTSAYSLLFISLSFITLDIPTLLYKVVFTNSITELLKDKIHFKNISIIESINQCDICVFEQEMLFENNDDLVEVASKNSNYDSNNLSDFAAKILLYYRLASPTITDDVVLNDFGVNLSEVIALCPVVSSYVKPNISLEMCGRIYNSENLLIVRASFSKILEMCSMSKDDISVEVLNSLLNNCNEIIGVAVKKVSVIPNDISEETSGFSFVGILGFNKIISDDTYSKLEQIGKSGMKPSILYTGDNKSISLLNIDSNFVLSDYNEIDKTNLKDVNLYYNYNDDPEALLSLCNKSHLRVFHGYEKKLSSKDVSFSSDTDKPVSQFASDLVCEFDFNKIYKLLLNSKYTVSWFKSFALNLIFLLIPIITFSSLFGENHFGVMVFAGVFISSFASLMISTILSDYLNAKTNTLIVKYLFISAILFLYMLCTSSIFSYGFVCTLILSVVDFDVLNFKTKNLLVFIPPILVIALISIFSWRITVIEWIISILVGLAISILGQFIKFIKR